MGRVLAAFLCVGLATGIAYDPGKGKGKGKAEHGQSVGVGAPGPVNFGRNDVYAIQQYYGAHPVNLPPGLQKNLARGKPLPPGWQKKLAPFPYDLDARMGPPCAYCGRGVYGGYGVIYDKRTSIILDVIQLATDILR